MVDRAVPARPRLRSPRPRTRTSPTRAGRTRGRRGRGTRGTSARRGRSRRLRRRRSGSRAAGRASGRISSRARLGDGHRAGERADGADADVGEGDRRERAAVDAVEEEAEGGDRDRAPRSRGTRAPRALFAAQIALRSDGARTSASKTPCSRSGTNARVSPSSAVKTIAVQSSPSETCGLAFAGTAKWKIVSAERTNRSIAGTVSLARSSISRSLRASAATSEKYLIPLPVELEPVEPPHANASLWVASRSTRAGSCVATTKARVPCELVERRVEQRRAGVVERVERLVEDHELRLVEQHAAEAEPLAHPAREGRDALVADLPEAEALEQHPDPLAAAPGAGRGARTGGGSRAGSARGRRAARGRGSRSRRGRAARARRASARRGRRACAAGSSSRSRSGP